MVHSLRDGFFWKGADRGTSLSLEKCGEEVFGGGIELLAKGGFVQSKSFGCRLIDGLDG